MTRLESMEMYLKPYISQRIREKVLDIKACSDRATPKVFNELLLKAIAKQEVSSWIPEYLAVFHLKSSMITGSNNYLVCLMNGQMYMDKERMEQDWYPDFLYNNLDQEKTLICIELRKKYIQIKDFEIEYAALQLYAEYKKIIQVYLVKCFAQLSSMPSFQLLKKNEPFSILYGDYMGEVKRIMIYEGGNLCVE